MNKQNAPIAIFLIVIGAIFLCKSNLISISVSEYWNIIWPTLIILVGVYCLFAFRGEAAKFGRWGSFKVYSEGDQKIVHWEPKNPVIKNVVGFVAFIFAMGVAILVLLGIVGPILLAVFGVVIIVVLIAIGAPLLGVLIPAAILAAPIALIVWLIGLLF